MAKEVIWSKSAKFEKDRILKFWIRNNGSTNYSIKLEKLINEIISNLYEYPQLGKRTSFDSVRVISLKNYQIFYRDKEQIQILIFWDSRQNPELLQEGIERI